MKDTKIYEIVDGKKKIIWKNFIGIRWSEILLIIVIILLALAYRHTTAECVDLVENPCSYLTQFDCSNETYRREDWTYQYYNITLNIPNATSKK